MIPVTSCRLRRRSSLCIMLPGAHFFSTDCWLFHSFEDTMYTDGSETGVRGTSPEIVVTKSDRSFVSTNNDDPPIRYTFCKGDTKGCCGSFRFVSRTCPQVYGQNNVKWMKRRHDPALWQPTLVCPLPPPRSPFEKQLEVKLLPSGGGKTINFSRTPGRPHSSDRFWILPLSSLSQHQSLSTLRPRTACHSNERLHSVLLSCSRSY